MPDNGLNRGGNPVPTEANPYSNPYGTNYGGYTPPQNPTTNPNYGTNYPTETRPAYTPNATGGYNVQEEGLASLTRFAHSKPYYVLHRTAPVGTTIIITNKANGKSATAEVAARMNPGDAPAGVVIEVSSAVMRRLGVNESQKPVVKIEYTMPRR
ncbi:MAG: hypothetical protein HC913_11420 [Microscillaceae bacterium]|nr:hypothetical protein [Microscillaceae bacterium]